MNELHLQDKFLVPFLVNELGYTEVHANTVNHSLIIERDLEAFLSETSLNKKEYEKLLRKFHGDKEALLKEVMELILERVWASRNLSLIHI